MARNLLIGLLLGVLAACSPEVRTVRVPVEVRVPVPVKAVPPAELKNCGREKPDFRFYRPDDARYSVALKENDTPKLRAWVEAKQNCIEAWGLFHE